MFEEQKYPFLLKQKRKTLSLQEKSGTRSYQNQSQINGVSDDKSAETPQANQLDPKFTQSVVNAADPGVLPRMRKVMDSLIRHLHDFARENEITVGEYMAGIEIVRSYTCSHCSPADASPFCFQNNESGRMSNDKRNEGQLVAGVIGLESLVDEITSKLASDATHGPTSTAILGPFRSANAPTRNMGESIVHDIPNSDHILMYGTVTDYLTGELIEGAESDVWHTAPNGLYKQQDENQIDFNSEDASQEVMTATITSIACARLHNPSPTMVRLGSFFNYLTDIQYALSAPDYKPIITQLFGRRAKYLTDDVTFAVKDSLVVDFLPRENDLQADYELPYNFRLATLEQAKKFSLVGTLEEIAGIGANGGQRVIVS